MDLDRPKKSYIFLSASTKTSSFEPVSEIHFFAPSNGSKVTTTAATLRSVNFSARRGIKICSITSGSLHVSWGLKHVYTTLPFVENIWMPYSQQCHILLASSFVAEMKTDNTFPFATTHKSKTRHNLVSCGPPLLKSHYPCIKANWVGRRAFHSLCAVVGTIVQIRWELPSGNYCCAYYALFTTYVREEWNSRHLRCLWRVQLV